MLILAISAKLNQLIEPAAVSVDSLMWWMQLADILVPIFLQMMVFYTES